MRHYSSLVDIMKTIINFVIALEMECNEKFAVSHILDIVKNMMSLHF